MSAIQNSQDAFERIKMSTLYLIRHGQASFGAENYDRLSEAGVKQARLLAERFCSLSLRFDAVYTGEMARQRDSAMELMNLCAQRNLPAPELKLDLAWNEYDFRFVLSALIPLLMQEDPGISEDVSRMLTDKSAFQRVFEKTTVRWVSGVDHVPGLMKWSDFKARVGEGIGRIMSRHGKGSRVAVFTSGGPIAVAVQRAMNISDEMTMGLTWQIVNNSYTRFMFTNSRFSLATFNEHPHLEDAGNGGLITYR
jgi:broad specificity phosphatase PhoE